MYLVFTSLSAEGFSLLERRTQHNLHAIGRCEVTNGQISLALNKHNGFSPEEECHSLCARMCVFSINCFLSNKFVAEGHHAASDMSPLYLLQQQP